MLRPLRIAVYHTNGEEPSLRRALEDIEGLRIVGRWEGACDLPVLVSQSRPDALAVVLNGAGVGAALEQLAAMSRLAPDLTLVGVGLPDDPGLLKAAMRARLSELLDLPVAPERLLAALQPASERRASRPAGRLIAVRGTGGGCGSTTIAMNLAVELAGLGRGRVAIADLDLHFGQIATLFDVSPTFTLAELLAHTDEYDARVLDNALVRHASGVSVLARPRDPASVVVAPARLAAVLCAMLEQYEWLVVDEPARSDVCGRVVQDLADHLLLVTQPVVTSVRNASQIMADLSAGFDRGRLRIVVNRVPRRPGPVTVSKVSDCLKRPIYCEVPADWKAVSHSINLGQPLARQAADSRARQAIRMLALCLAGEAASQTTRPPRRSVVQWFRGRLARV